MRPGRTKDYYQALGLPEDASSAAVKKAYRKLAKQYHPDANRNDPNAGERFKEVSEAYAVLSDQEKRKQYDRMRRFTPLDDLAGSGATGGERRGFSIDDLGGGLGDLFSSIFDFGRGQKTRVADRGRDVEHTVEVPFRTAARGGQITVAVPVTEACATCDGSGARPGTSTTKCPDCGGTGIRSVGQGGFAISRACPSCYGRGEIATDPCPSCGGHGQVRTERRVNLRIPAGVENGSRVRMSGMGERGSGGGPPGDLIIRFEIKQDRFFRRRGLDVYCTVPINLAQATLGSRLRVRTVEGKHVVLRVPPGTDSGTKFRIPKMGIEKDGRRGDQYVEVKITVPDELDTREEDLMREFAELTELKY
ncbi:MAG: molecular chaperone DnaJ [Gemmatimonadota bacterium]|nr:molecular chaperone DnaJ [Candidatus Palauibacterales bacterium]